MPNKYKIEVTKVVKTDTSKVSTTTTTLIDNATDVAAVLAAMDLSGDDIYLEVHQVWDYDEDNQPTQSSAADIMNAVDPNAPVIDNTNPAPVDPNAPTS